VPCTKALLVFTWARLRSSSTHACSTSDSRLRRRRSSTSFFRSDIPVFAPGALFEIGDGHAAQGDGEVDQTAIETSLRGKLQLTVRKDMTLVWPRAETPTDYIAMATDPDLTVATSTAIQEMVNFMVDLKGLTKHQAYQLVSIAGNVAVTQLVDKPNVGVHVRLPKSIFKK